MEQQWSYLDQYKIIKTLGNGYYSKVKLAQCPNHQLVAIKRFKKQTTDMATLQQEFSILSKLHHENILNLIDVRPTATYKKKDGVTYTCFAIVIQYAGGGQLFDFIALGGRFSPCVSRTYFRQIMSGIGYMHSQGYAHRDIKPQNILLTQDFKLKIADFGFSTLLEGKDHSGILHTRLGTEGYIAPQIQNRNYIGTQVDIFSCGVILFIMYTATPPFEKSFPNDPKYNLIKEKKYEQFWQIHQKRRFQGFFSDQFKDLIQRMVEYDPKQRITLQQIKKHPWTNGDIYQLHQIRKQFKLRKQKVDAELRKQKQQRQLKRRQRHNAIRGVQINQNEEKSDITTFLQNYNKQTLIDRKLPIKTKIEKGDYILKEDQDYFFSSIITLLNNPIHITDSENQINFNSKCIVKQNKLEIIMVYKYQNFNYNLIMEIIVTKTIQNDICLSFKRVSGNLFYYKKMIHFICLKFSHHEVHQIH